MLMAQNKSSNIFIELSKEIKQKNFVFNYPLNCIFERTRYDPNWRAYHVVDRLNVNLQEGSLTEGVNLHLTDLAKSEHPYRLNVKLVDNHGIHLHATQWLSLTRTGTIDVNNLQEFNTLYVEIHTNT
jgi:hypothetical protein